MIILYWLILLLFAFTIFSKFSRGQALGGAYYAILPFAIPSILVWLLAKMNVGSVVLENFGAAFKPLFFIAVCIAALIGLIQLVAKSERLKSMRLTGMGAILGILVAGIGGYGFLDLTETWFTGDNSRNVSSLEADYKLTSQEITQQFDEDKDRSETRFQDKVMEISGVLKIEEDIVTEQKIYFFEGHGPFNTVILEFPEGKAEDPEFVKMVEAKANQQISVKGWCNGWNMQDVKLRDVLFEW